MFTKDAFTAASASYGGKVHLIFEHKGPPGPSLHLFCGCPNSSNGYAANRLGRGSADLDKVSCLNGQKKVAAWKADQLEERVISTTASRREQA